MPTRVFRAPKVPEVFLLFWVVKLLTTGIGESGADFLGTVSIPLAALVGIGGFFVALWLQLRSTTYHPVRYWVTVLSVALFGTMIADGPHVALGTPYYVDSAIYFVLLCGLLTWWKRSEGTLSVHSIYTARRERFYWGTVLLTFGLGTALGDTTAINLGLGFGLSIVLFGVLILVPLGLWRLGLNATVAFWASYVLTRPLGASVADWLGKPPSSGGLGWGDGTVTGLGLLIFAALVAYVTITHSDVEGAHGLHHDDEPQVGASLPGVTSFNIPGSVLTDHVLTLPLDHDHLDGETIEVFAREVAAPDGRDRPFLVFLQGGPGQEAPRPVGRPSSPAWLHRALRDYRVLMLDQRGTGRSTPYGAPGTDPAADAERLTHFRADAIVRDAESFREHLGVDRWSVLGQSFGGFCSLHYLSAFPDSLDAAFFTGGLPPVGRPVDDIYSTTFETMRMLNARYHRQFPMDRERLARILDLCDAGEVLGRDGTPVSRRLMRTIGNHFGMDGGAEAVHYLLERDPRSPAFAHDFSAMVPFNARNPLYAVIHESSYADGVVTGWSSERVEPDDFRDDSLLLTGEHLFPWHFEDCADLRPYREVASILADHPWPKLYDADVLAQVDVPCAAAIYADDPFVDRQFSEQTADLLPGMRRWLTDEYLHNGLRSDGDRVLDRLIGLARGTV